MVRLSKILRVFFFLALQTCVVGNGAAALMTVAKTDAAIVKLYKKMPNALSLGQRVRWFSQQFLGTPYRLGALGEGPAGEFDQDPLYRVDGFDCVTFVSTVLALAEATDLASFRTILRYVRYRDGLIRFRNRNHFMSVDWNPENTRNGFIHDIAHRILDKTGKPIARVATTIINKPSWYRQQQLPAIHLTHPKAQQAERQLARLHVQAKQVQQEFAVLSYLPLATLFPKGRADEFYFNQLPDVGILEIVRPDWQLRDKIGTNLHVSHLGFVLRYANGLWFRHASSEQHRVVNVLLKDYLRHYLRSPTVQGIAVFTVTSPRRLLCDAG